MSLQIPFGSGLPTSIGQQVPSIPGKAQETQGPWQATLQQNPFAQKPDRQSVFLLQSEPMSRLPQLPAESQA